MKVKQTIDCPITIKRFDTNEDVTFEKDVEIEVDEATGNYLLEMVTYYEGELATNFIKVE